MRLQTATISNQNISAYLLADTYTADADRELTVFVALNQVAGGGDYSVYLTRQLAGAGAAYMVGPITTFTVPAAQTAIAFQSITVEVEDTDVVKVYVKGLAGDTTTPDIITRWFDVTALHSQDVADAVLDEAIGAHTGFLTTLAVAGDQMDLVDAPNATAVGAIQFGLATPADVEALLTLQIDGTLTFGQALAVMVARLAGPTSGGGTATIIFSNPTGTQARITMPITSAFDDRGVPTFSFTGV